MVEPRKLLANIQKVFKEQDNYIFDKYVPEFTQKGKFFADCYNITIVEPRENKPPRFYHTFSPFDVISNKAPDQALVFEDGQLILSTDFTSYVKDRTGAMDSLILLNTGVDSMLRKRILYLGSGGTAQASLKVLKSHFADLSEVDCINSSDDITEFEKIGKKLGVKIFKGSYDRIEGYDYIFCHTATDKALLTENMIPRIKQGATITTFISSTDYGEVADEFYDKDNANIIVDWHQTLQSAKDLARALQNDKIQESNVIYLRDFLDNADLVDSSKKYTIYRSVGTPMQNLAVLQLLLDDKYSQ